MNSLKTECRWITFRGLNLKKKSLAANLNTNVQPATIFNLNDGLFKK